MIKLDVYSTQAVIRSQEPLTVGLTGAAVQLRFSEHWSGLTKTVVFRQGGTSVDVICPGETVTIPAEVLLQPGLPLEIGIYGCDSSGKLAIPTLWAATDPVQPGADPAAAVNLEPASPVYQQILGMMGDLNALQTVDQANLVAAINEARGGVYVVKVQKTDGVWGTDQTLQQLQAAKAQEKALICHLTFEDVYLPLVTMAHTSASIFTFAGQWEGISYCVTVSAGGVTVQTEPVAAVFPVTVSAQEGKWVSDKTVAQIRQACVEGLLPVCLWVNGSVTRRLCLLLQPGDGAAATAMFSGMWDGTCYQVSLSDVGGGVVNVSTCLLADTDSKLPNPHALTFPDGTVYDGSQAVDAPAANDRSVAAAYLRGGTGSQEFYLSGHSASELAAAARAGLEVMVYATENGMEQRYSLIKKGQKSGGYTMVFAHIAELETRYLEVTDDGSAAGMIFLYSTVLDTDKIGAVPVPQKGTVGQALVVGEVDALGRPASWETAPLSGGWRLINTVTTTEDALSRVTCTTDSAGQPLSLTEVYVKTVLPASTTVSGSNFIYLNGGYFNGPAASTKVGYGSLYANGILDQVSSANGDYAQWYLHGNRPIPNGPYITKVELVGQSGGKNIPLGTTLEIWGR